MPCTGAVKQGKTQLLDVRFRPCPKRDHVESGNKIDLFRRVRLTPPPRYAAPSHNQWVPVFVNSSIINIIIGGMFVSDWWHFLLVLFCSQNKRPHLRVRRASGFFPRRLETSTRMRALFFSRSRCVTAVNAAVDMNLFVHMTC